MSDNQILFYYPSIIQVHFYLILQSIIIFSFFSLPLICQPKIKDFIYFILILAWSAKGEDVNENFQVNGESIGSEVQKTSKDARENGVAEQDRSSINGSRGMLQKIKKNIVTPLDEEPSGSESGATRINVAGKRSGMENFRFMLSTLYIK